MSRPAFHIENMRHKVISGANPFTAKLAYKIVKAVSANAGLKHTCSQAGVGLHAK